MSPKPSPKPNPKPITSFMEDDFDVIAYRQSVQKSLQIQKNAHIESTRRNYIILAIRIVMAIAAAVLCIWLYFLVDNFITHQQLSRVSSRVSVSEHGLFAYHVVAQHHQNAGENLAYKAWQVHHIHQ